MSQLDVLIFEHADRACDHIHERDGQKMQIPQCFRVRNTPDGGDKSGAQKAYRSLGCGLRGNNNVLLECSPSALRKPHVTLDVMRPRMG